MVKTLGNTLRIFICAVLTLQLVGCGTLMYPERRGQRGGRLDVGVTILDGIGLLFFIIPGVIAFAVDFSNGTIYLPERGLRDHLSLNNLRAIKFNPKYTSMASIERIIKDQTGCEVKLDQDNVKVAKLRSLNDMMVQFAKAMPITQNDRIALL
jgi:hypothetical protein